jgi:hypothetical protein
MTILSFISFNFSGPSELQRMFSVTTAFQLVLIHLNWMEAHKMNPFCNFVTVSCLKLISVITIIIKIHEFEGIAIFVYDKDGVLLTVP